MSIDAGYGDERRRLVPRYVPDETGRQVPNPEASVAAEGTTREEALLRAVEAEAERSRGATLVDPPRLTEAERELLVMLMEEAGEVVQAAAKVLRHGWESVNPHDPLLVSNRDALDLELRNVLAVLELMRRSRHVDARFGRPVGVSFMKLVERKLAYTHHQLRPWQLLDPEQTTTEKINDR